MKTIQVRLSLMLASCFLASGAPILTIQDLGSLGGSRAAGTAINQSGQVAGYGTDAMNDFRPFSTFAQVLVPAGADGGSAHGINGNGIIAGVVNLQGHSQATLWVNGAAQALGGLGGADSYAYAINSQQQVAGMAQNANGAGRAVIYSGGGVTDVSLPGFESAAAMGINSQGAIAGNALDAAMHYRAYTWSPGGGYLALGTLGGSNSYAFGINDAGWIAGHSTLASGYAHAFLWTGEGIQDLGTLGGANSYGYGINGAGAVVGYSDVSGAGTHAFLYANGMMWDLNALVADLDGWELIEAYGINDAGQITGTGLLNGVQHAFRLNPLKLSSAGAGAPVPEPSTLWLIAAGLGFAATRRITRRRR